jgi:hypothetical protein
MKIINFYQLCIVLLWQHASTRLSIEFSGTNTLTSVTNAVNTLNSTGIFNIIFLENKGSNETHNDKRYLTPNMTHNLRLNSYYRKTVITFS